MYTQIDSKIVIKYLVTLKEKSGLTYEAIAEASRIPESLFLPPNEYCILHL